MKIKEITSQHRRDFVAIYECDHCGHEITMAGYDDTYFHQEVIPNLICVKCNQKAKDTYRPLTTKYPEGFTV